MLSQPSLAGVGAGAELGNKQDSSRKCSAWKDFRFKLSSFHFPQRDRVKCGGLGLE